MRYVLEIEEAQAEVIQHALELLGRVSMGQLEEIQRACFYDVDAEKAENAKAHLEVAKFHLTGLSGGSYIGIHGTKENVKIGWDLYQVIRHRLAWDRNPAGGFTTQYDQPMHYSGY